MIESLGVQRQQERVGQAQPEREGGRLRKGEEKAILFPPHYSFSEAKLKFLYYLFHNGSSYSAKISREIGITPARVTQIIKELGKQGILRESKIIAKCSLCTGLGNRSFGGELRICTNCVGKGSYVQKTYPMFVEVAEDAKPHCLRLFYLMKGIGELKGGEQK